MQLIFKRLLLHVQLLFKVEEPILLLILSVQNIYFLIKKPVGHAYVHKLRRNNGRLLDVDQYTSFFLNIRVIYWFIFHVFYLLVSSSVRNNIKYFIRIQSY